ncbi:hypothetical protein [Adhaeribacter aquaticus]|uniref:hypothetical protein n=1 Tax=Adhaeribacter aquaticus TaxID=299567 RepID=UPI00040011AB|nr:hypothetical protein [Adhaeribacter aquaticus]
MKENQKKDQDKQLVKDINSVNKASEDNADNLNLPQNMYPKSGGRQGAKSVQDGGQDVGSSAGSR